MAEETKRIRAVFETDVSKYNSSLDGINKQMKLARSETRLTQKEMEAFGVTSDSVAKAQDKLNKQIELHNKKIELYSKAIKESSDTVDKNIKKRSELNKKVEEAEVALKNAEKAFGKESSAAKEASETLNEKKKALESNEKAIEANVKKIADYETEVNNSKIAINNLEGAIEKNNKALKEKNDRLKNVTDGLDEFGDKAIKTGDGINKMSNKILGLSASVATLIGASAKMTMDFEKGIANVNTLLDDTTNLDKYRNKIVQLSDDTGIAVETVTDGMYQAISSLGDLGDQTNKIFEKMTKGAKAGNAEVSDSVSLLAAGMKSYGEINEETAGKISDLAFQTAKLGVTTFPEMAKSMQPLFPLASTLNISIEDLFTNMATLTGVTGNTAEVSTQLKAVFSNLIKPTTDMQALIKKYGYESAQAMIESEGFAGVLGILQTETDGSADKMGKLFSSTEALTAMIALTGEQYDTFISKSGEMENSLGATEKALKKIEDTDADKFAKSMNELKNSFIDLGKSALPIVDKVTEAIGKVADVIKDLDDEAIDTIINITAMGLAVGGTGKIIGGTVSTVGNLSKGLSGAIKMIKNTDKNIGGLGKTATTATEGVKLITKATTGVGTAASVASGAAGVGGLASGLGGLALAAAPWLLAGAGVVAVGYGIHKNMSEEVIPSVDLFADGLVRTGTVMTEYGEIAQITTVKISEETAKQVQAYLDLDEQAKAAIGDLYYSSLTMTDEYTTDMTSKYQELGSTITGQIQKDKENDLSTLSTFIENSTELTDQQMADMLRMTDTSYALQTATVEAAQNRIIEILQLANEESRGLKDSEFKEITELQNKMKTHAVETLSTQEQEAQVILDRMTAYDKRITAEMVSDNIKEFNKQEEEAIDAANSQYREVVAVAENLRKAGTEEATKMADTMIEEAERQRDGTIEAAKDTRDKAVEKITKMNEEVSKDVDTTTGDIMNFWDKMHQKWDNWFPKKKTTTIENTTINTTVNRTKSEGSSKSIRNSLDRNIYSQLSRNILSQLDSSQLSRNMARNSNQSINLTPSFVGEVAIIVDDKAIITKNVNFIDRTLQRKQDSQRFGGICFE